MQLKSIALALTATITTLSFAGGGQSTEERPKIKIASVKTLEERVAKAQLAHAFLTDIKFFETFADKEMTDKELEAGFTTITNNLYSHIKGEMGEQLGMVAGTTMYYALMPKMTADINQQFTKAKPVILEVLLKEDYPELYTQLAGIPASTPDTTTATTAHEPTKSWPGDNE